MMYALDLGNQRIKATPKAYGVCPDCDQKLLARCGVINIWHWSHTQQTDCDHWSEPESNWHMRWKGYWPESCVEVSMQSGNERHRADVYCNNTVLELQYSSISPDEIAVRERFYQQMVWVFDVKDAFDTDRLNIRRKENYHTFRWKHPRKHLAYCQKPIILDLGDDIHLFRIKKIHTETPCGGWGNLLNKSEFIKSYGGQY